MSTAFVGRTRKAKSSVVYCNEKFSCVDDKALAEYECDDCKSAQCSTCERKLHQFAGQSFHERKKLDTPSDDLLCQRPSCDDRNFSDVNCESCALRLCWDCDRKVHLQSNKKLHKRIAILDNKKEVLTTTTIAAAITQGLNDFILREEEDRICTPIKPLSPLSYQDDSLTFVSLPQHEEPDFHSCLVFDNTESQTSKVMHTIPENDEGQRSALMAFHGSIQSGITPDKKQRVESENIEIGKKLHQLQTKEQRQQKQQKTLRAQTDLLNDKTRDKTINRKDQLQSIPDIAATLPVDCDYEKEDSDMADIIADSLQRSAMMDDNMYDSTADEDSSKVRSFPLANQYEELQVKDEEEFIRLLCCERKALAKVISIFGNTGDGKSYTLNHTFFEGKDVFKTSPLQDSCTAGIWAAYDELHKAIVIDTEGMLGMTNNQNQRMRLLLKVLAISDIIIYRTRAERLNSDLFQFLGDASKAYLKHFSVELKSASKRFHLDKSVSTLGPSVIIFHETQHTDILAKGASEPAEKLLRDRFRDMNLNLDAFSSLQYVGTHTKKPPTDFKSLLWSVKKQLNNNEIRCSRNPGVVFRTLKILNEKFMDEIDKAIPNMFPDQYFTCRAECLSCNTRCIYTMNHLKDDISHEAEKDKKCKHQAQFYNTIYTCKECFRNGRTVIVIPKTSASTDSSWLGLATYAWSGYVLECSHCGVIYRSRQHWYGNPDPEKTVVRTELRHVWPDGNTVLHGSHNAARRFLDGINYVSESIAVVGAKPTKMVSDWLTDRIAPSYWVPNIEIKECKKCKLEFCEKIKIHHCRSCGNGFCDGCSSKKRPCPERNWGMEPVRVCDACFHRKVSDDELLSDSSNDTSNEIMPRKVGEAIGSTVGAIATIVNYPLVAIRDAARPTYWMPDEEIKDCCICKQSFGIQLKLHHCRSCGKGVCDVCSASPRPVPSRGWDHPVRVCKICFVKEKEL